MEVDEQYETNSNELFSFLYPFPPRTHLPPLESSTSIKPPKLDMQFLDIYGTKNGSQRRSAPQPQNELDQITNSFIRYIRSPSFLNQSTNALLSQSKYLYVKYQKDARYECRDRERETKRLLKRYTLNYIDDYPQCIECGRYKVSGFYNDNSETNEEDLFWCTQCKKRERRNEYSNAYAMRSICSAANCPQQTREQITRIAGTDSVEIKRCHILLADKPLIRLLHGRKDESGTFYCNACWKLYIECDDLKRFAYDPAQNPFRNENSNKHCVHDQDSNDNQNDSDDDVDIV